MQVIKRLAKILASRKDRGNSCFEEKEIAMPIAYANDIYSSQSSTYSRAIGRSLKLGKQTL